MTTAGVTLEGRGAHCLEDGEGAGKDLQMLSILAWALVPLSRTLNMCVFYYAKATAQKKHPKLKMAGESSTQCSISYALLSS